MRAGGSPKTLRIMEGGWPSERYALGIVHYLFSPSCVDLSPSASVHFEIYAQEFTHPRDPDCIASA